jgi:GT2 family glycosyltransferase
MDLSIIIVNWNTREYLKNCLLSILAGAGQIDYCVYVVDNGSSDGSAEMVRKEFPTVCLIENGENRGFAAANNQALKQAGSRYVLLLNSDTAVQPGAPARLVKFMDEHPEAAACGPLLLNEDGSVQHAARRFPTFAFALYGKTVLGRLNLFKRAYLRVKMDDADFNKTMEVDQPSGAALMLRSSVLEKVGLLDERFFIFFEEVDLCRRIKNARHKIYIYPEARIRHYGGGSRRKNRAQVMMINANSMLRYFRKHERPLKCLLFEIVFRPLFILDVAADLAGNAINISLRTIWKSDSRKITARKAVVSSEIDVLKKEAIPFLLSIGE